MAVNYNDELNKVETNKQNALTDLNNTYDGMINESDKYYQAQIDASKEQADKQTQLQQKNTDFAIKKIEQQKEQAHKDYLKEQKGAYTDWQKQSNPYGVNAEQMAAQGLANSGYSESSQVAMYTAYQNRVATARESFNTIKMNFDNGIREAQLQNDSILAEIYAKAQQAQLELSLQGFQYKNQLLLEKADKKTQIENTYWSQYQEVLAQIEQQRQFNETQALREREMSLAEAKFQYEKEQDAIAMSQISGSSGSGNTGSGGGGNKVAPKSYESLKPSSNNTDKNTLSVDEKSKNLILSALGLRNVSAKQFNDLISRGVIVEYEKDGRLYYKKGTLLNSKTLPNSVQQKLGLVAKNKGW